MTTLTPHLGLRVDSGLTNDTKYNLYRIDDLASRIKIAISGNTNLLSYADISIQARTSVGVSPINGRVTISAGNLQSNDATSTVAIEGRNVVLTTNSNGVEGTVDIHATSVNLNGATLSNLPLAEGKVFIGGVDGYAHPQTVGGDVTIDKDGVLLIETGVLTGEELASNSINTANIVNNAVTSGKILSVDWTKVTKTSANITDIPLRSHSDLQDIGISTHVQIDAHLVNASNPHSVTKAQILAISPLIDNSDVAVNAAIAYSKLSLTGSVKNTDISATAAIEQSKVLNLVSALAGKEPTLTKGNLTTTTGSIVIGGGTGAVIGAGTTINQTKADATNDGYLSSSDWVRFNNGGVPTGDLTESVSSVLTITGGTNAVVGTGTTVQIKQAGAAQSGYLSSTDWSLFNGKEPPVTKGNLTTTTTGVTVGSGTGAVIGTGTTVDIQTASGTQPGLLSASDFASFSGKQAGDADLTAIAALSGPGFSVKTSTDPAAAAWTTRAVAGTSNRVGVTNGDGVSGNPTINIDTALLPSPAVGDIGKVLSATGENTAAWTSSRYSVALFWSGVGPYTMAITGATHLRGTNPLVQIKEQVSGTSYKVVNIDEITIDSSTGDISLSSVESITGTVVIL